MKKIFKTKDLALYYDGNKFYFGEMQKEDLFVSELQVFGEYFNEDQINGNFNQGQKNVTCLSVINDNNTKNFGLIDEEFEFLSALYNRGFISSEKLLELQIIFNNEASSRLKANKALQELTLNTKPLNQLAGISPEDEMV